MWSPYLLGVYRLTPPCMNLPLKWKKKTYNLLQIIEKSTAGKIIHKAHVLVKEMSRCRTGALANFDHTIKMFGACQIYTVCF